MGCKILDIEEFIDKHNDIYFQYPESSIEYPVSSIEYPESSFNFLLFGRGEFLYLHTKLIILEMPKLADIDLSSIKLHGTEDQSLAQSKLFLHTLNSIGDCISITDMNDIIIYVNKSFTATYGYLAEELVGQHITMLRSDKNDAAVLEKILPQTLKEGWRGRIWNKRKNGEEFLIELYSTIVYDEKEILWLLLVLRAI